MRRKQRTCRKRQVAETSGTSGTVLGRSKKRRMTLVAFASPADADRADREYWWSRTPAARLRELERLRQINYGYGQGRPLPRFQSVLRVADLREG
jgi:hypothetical protein